MKEELISKLESLKKEAFEGLESLKSLKDLQKFRIHIFGKKGLLREILSGLGKLSAEDRPVVGELANSVKREIESKLGALQQKWEEAERAEGFDVEKVDVTLPGLDFGKGRLHPLRLVTRQLEFVFLKLGFSIFEGPDVETDYYNFSALNFPADHPAKEMQDTFYIKLEKGERLLRTHTSPVQIRTMEKRKPPLYMIAPGTVYRHDDDVTHSPMFHQIEGLAVDENITLGDLKGVLTLVCKEIFGKERKVRFRPSFFPFVEPGAEIDISCRFCKGKGCRVCSGSGWLEILGAGMVHPNVLEEVDIDPKKYSGFAFGLGVERVAMLKYGIHDIRLFFESDMRFLEQF